MTTLAALPPQMHAIVWLGVLLLVAIGVQIAIGYRKIKFKGRTHWKVHKAVAWTVLGIALVHGLYALTWIGIIPLPAR